MKKDFTTGVMILLPVVITLLIVSFLVNFLTEPFLESTRSWLEHTGIFPHSFLFLSKNTILTILSRVLIILALSFIVFLTGMLGQLFLIDYLINLGEMIIHRIPFINRIYKPCREGVHTLLSSSNSPFSQVVLVPYPDVNQLSMGLITKESLTLHHSSTNKSEILPVFIPGTPNPSVGFMFMYRRDQMIFLDMNVKDALKFVISGGSIVGEISTRQDVGQNEQ